jgi:hypothetical protein
MKTTTIEVGGLLSALSARGSMAFAASRRRPPVSS